MQLARMMIVEEMLDILKGTYSANEPIFTRDLLALFPNTSRRTVFHWLKQAEEKGEIGKASRGVYYLPTQTLLGPSVLPVTKILARKYLTDGDTVYGYWGGLLLENQMGLTTQNPSVLEIVSNRATKRLTRLGPMGGYRDVVLRAPRNEVTARNVDTLRFLDLVTALPPSSVSDAIMERLGGIARKINRNDALREVGNYPAKTSRNLLESGLLDVLARRPE